MEAMPGRFNETYIERVLIEAIEQKKIAKEEFWLLCEFLSCLNLTLQLKIKTQNQKFSQNKGQKQNIDFGFVVFFWPKGYKGKAY